MTRPYAGRVSPSPRTTAHRLALSAYRRLPVPVRRVVVRPFTPRYGVGALAVLRDGDEVLMLRQRHHHGWTLPGGFLDRGETPREALARELSEELSVRLELPAEPSWVSFDPAARQVDVFFVVDAGGGRPEVQLDGTEALAASWRPLSEGAVPASTRAMLERLAGAADGATGDRT